RLTGRSTTTTLYALSLPDALPISLRNRPRDPDDGSVARHLVASARGGARIPRRIEQVSLQLPVAATRGGIVQARLTFPTRPAKSRPDEVERLVLGIGAQGRNRTPTRGFSVPFCPSEKARSPLGTSVKHVPRPVKPGTP